MKRVQEPKKKAKKKASKYREGENVPMPVVGRAANRLRKLIDEELQAIDDVLRQSL